MGVTKLVLELKLGLFLASYICLSMILHFFVNITAVSTDKEFSVIITDASSYRLIHLIAEANSFQRGWQTLKSVTRLNGA